MITIGNIYRADPFRYDKAYAIVRSFRHPVEGFQQLDTIAPDWHLLGAVNTWRREGIWNTETFSNIYVPQFLQGIHESPAARRTLNNLFLQSETQNILLVCFCGREDICHRSIIAGLLQGAGANVNPLTPNYTKYWEKYKEGKDTNGTRKRAN